MQTTLLSKCFDREKENFFYISTITGQRNILEIIQKKKILRKFIMRKVNNMQLKFFLINFQTSEFQ